MRIGELACRAGVTTDTIRFYEREGLLPPPDRSANGYRSYSSAALEDLTFIRKGRSLGLSLAEIRDVMTMTASGLEPCDHVRAALHARLEDVERRLEELGALRVTLMKGLARLDDARIGPASCRCAAIEGHD